MSQSGTSEQADSRLLTLGRKVDELFVQQYDRIGLHNDEEENGYRREENRLAGLMLDKTLSNEQHIEHAHAILTLTDTYTKSFIQSLRSLNDEIDRHLLACEDEINTRFGNIAQPNQELTEIIGHVRRWMELSRELQKSRLVATETIPMRVDCDKVIPNSIIANGGRADASLSMEDSSRFQETLTAVSSMLEQSFADNERIQKERLPLTKMLFIGETNQGQPSPPDPPPLPAQPPPRIHPLAGKAWFRFVKVLYICLWFLAGGFCLLLATGSDNVDTAIGAAAISAVVLVLLRMGFYYVTLGRTTVAEKAGTGFLDWDELSASFDTIRANDPETFKSVIEPFLTSWKQQYGRRVPMHAYQVFQKRVNSEIERTRQRTDQVIQEAAKKGATVDIASLRAKMEKTKAEYIGSDRAEFVRGIDAFIAKLEAQYGTSIPIAESSRLLDELEEKIRKDELK